MLFIQAGCAASPSSRQGAGQHLPATGGANCCATRHRARWAAARCGTRTIAHRHPAPASATRGRGPGANRGADRVRAWGAQSSSAVAWSVLRLYFSVMTECSHRLISSHSTSDSSSVNTTLMSCSQLAVSPKRKVRDCPLSSWFSPRRSLPQLAFCVGEMYTSLMA